MSSHADKRLPRPTPLTQPWWEACQRQELLIQQCVGCGHLQFYPRSLCTACGTARVEWLSSAGKGKIRSFTVIRHPVSRAYADEVPYVLALIELDEGPTLMSAVRDCDPESVCIGQAVEVMFERWADQVTMPLFRPA